LETRAGNIAELRVEAENALSDVQPRGGAQEAARVGGVGVFVPSTQAIAGEKLVKARFLSTSRPSTPWPPGSRMPLPSAARLVTPVAPGDSMNRNTFAPGPNSAYFNPT